MNNPSNISSPAAARNVKKVGGEPSGAIEPKPRAILFLNDDSFAGVCAWCDDKTEADAWCQDHGYRVTHTICSSCRGRFQEEERVFACRRYVA